MTAASREIAVVNYGLGNLFSICQAVVTLGYEPRLVSTPTEIHHAAQLILPGVGAFGRAMDNLRTLDLVGPITDFAQSGKPLLGICLGMQLLFDSSDEHGRHDGLGLIPGRVERFPYSKPDGSLLRVPNIGWARVAQLDSQGSSASPYMYFVHTYVATPERPADVQATSSHGGLQFCAAVRAGGLFGTQYHPEKSGPAGLRQLDGWLHEA